jgi:8-oxo-dGTP pyrophosphatase MutT (NUDIX family)
MPTFKQKVVAYITHGRRLLVFSHPEHPRAGIQVPAGTVEPGEHPDAAVLREAAEETGLPNLTTAYLLGEQRGLPDPKRDEIHDRFFYHLPYEGNPPETWRHGEFDPSDRTKLLIPFDFFWADPPDGVPELHADQGRYLPELIELLFREYQ